MITLFKSPLSEHVLPDAPFYPLIVDAIKRHNQKSYVPLLLGIIRNEGAPDAIFGAKAYKELGDKTYYCIDFYEYNESDHDVHAFTHVTTLGKDEITPFKKQLLSCFDPCQEVSRVRFALDAIKQNNSKMANVWVTRCLRDPVTKRNEKYFIDLIQYLVSPTDLSHRDLPLAKRVIDHLFEKDPKHKFALDYLADIGELYRMGAKGVPQDLLAAERYLLRVVQRDKTDATTRVALGVLYCKGGSNFVANTQEGLRFLLEAIRLDPLHINALNCLGDLYSARDVYRAKYYFEQVLAQDPKNSFAKNGLSSIEEHFDIQAPRFQIIPVRRVAAVEDVLKTAELDDAAGFVEEELCSLAQQEVEVLLNRAAVDDTCNLLVSLAHAEQICN